MIGGWTKPLLDKTFKLIRIFFKILQNISRQKTKKQLIISEKSPWLNPTDGFGILEKGTVHDASFSKTLK